MEQPVQVQTSLRNKRGFTLIEVLIAFVILIIGLLGLLTTVNVAMVHNLKNATRDEVTRIASSTMQEMRSQPFDSVVSDTAATPVTSRLRSMTKQYQVRRTVTNLDTRSRQYQVDVTWTHKDESFTHSITSIRTTSE
jgi:type IV pilus assembly protein PilV